MICTRASILTLLLTATVLVSPAHAQDLACTYDRCALRLQHTAFSDRIVQGTGATVVGRLGLFAPRVEPLATAGDSARNHYESFRTHQNRGGALSIVGAIAGVATLVILSNSIDRQEDPPGVVWGLIGFGAAFSIAGSIDIRIGRDQLQQALWFYNRSLVGTR